MTFTPEVWDGVLRRLQSELPSFSYEAWLAPLVAKEHERGVLLQCPSSFHRDRVRNHYLGQITECLQAEIGRGIDVELCVTSGERASECAGELPKTPDAKPSAIPAASRSSSPAAPETPRFAADAESRAERGPARVTRRSPPGMDDVDAPARHAPSLTRSSTSPPARHGVDAPPRYASARARGTSSGGASPFTFDSFVVGPCNALAREASLAIAQHQQRSLNQLYLCSRPGMGKTHLSRAVAAEATRLANGEVRYLSAEAFTNEFLAALRSHHTADFKRRYRSRCQLLVIEDIQFLECKSATQLEFFHTVGHVLDAGGRVVLSGDRLPHELSELQPRLRSQLTSGFVAELEPPDAQVRRAILRDKAARGGVHLPPDCLDRLVESVKGSVRELESVLIQLVTTASLMKRPIDAMLTETAIAKKIVAASRRQPRLDVASVIRVVAGFFQTTSDKLAGRSRRKQVLVPRQLAMYLCRRFTEASVSDIGRALGRDHPSVRNAIQKIEREMLERAPLRYQVEALSERLEEMLKSQDIAG